MTMRSTLLGLVLGFGLLFLGSAAPDEALAQCCAPPPVCCTPPTPPCCVTPPTPPCCTPPPAPPPPTPPCCDNGPRTSVHVNGVSVVTSLSVIGLAERGWEVTVAAPRYPTAMRDAFPPDVMRAGARELLLLPSAPLPFYPDIRLSLPNATALSELVDPEDSHA